MSATAHAKAAAVLEEALQLAEVEYESTGPGAYVVTIPGRRKLKTLVWLRVGAHSLLVRSFFCRRPDENDAEFYRWLLSRNLDFYALAFAVDEVGDVYLTGRVALGSITPEEVDRLLGCVLEYSDEHFNTALELGFASAIRREWAWRTARGESRRHLSAFRHLVEPE